MKGGIFYGWWIVIAGLFANFAWAEQFNSSYGVFVGHVGDEMSWGRTALAGVQTVTRVPEALATLFLGPFVDRHGARWLVAAGGVVVGASFISLSTIDQLWQLYLYKGLVMAIGAACLGGFVGVTVSNWFVAKRGRALGIVTMGTALATLTMPLLGAFMIESWGWRQAWAAMGVVVLVCTIPATVLFRRRPEDLGMRPDGAEPRAGLDRTAGERARLRREALLRVDAVWTRGQVLRTPTFWVMTYGWGMAGLAVSATNLHIVPYLQDFGYPLTIAAGAISLRAAMMLVTNPLWGLAVERWSIKRTALIPFLFSAAAMLLFLVSPTPPGLVTALVLYGIGNGGSQVLQETVWADYYGRVSLGLVRGLVNPLQNGFSALGPLVMGLLFDLSGSYQSSWLVLMCGFSLAALLMLFVSQPRVPGPAAQGPGRNAAS